MSRLVWLFEEHRDAITEVNRLTALVGSQEHIIKDLGAQLILALSRPSSTPELLENYRKDILAEEPFKDGVVPEPFWLSPGSM
mgnify:FL=1